VGRSLNKVTLIGTLGRDPEVRFMPNGNPVANISLATDESYNDRQTGQKVEQTEWHRITIYGKLAEIVQQYLKKGSKAYFEGKLRTREWERDGIKRYTTEIIAHDMLMLDSRADGHGVQGGQSFHGLAPHQNSHPQHNAASHDAGISQAGDLSQQAQPGANQPPRSPQPSNAFDDFDDDIPF
jgi:single-strand DNA-binding protein